MIGDNVAAVTWANLCGGARNKRAGLMMRRLGRLEIQGGWRYDAKHIPGLQNVSRRYFTLAAIRTSRQGETVDEHRRLV